jgi:hypothetical protein
MLGKTSRDLFFGVLGNMGTLRKFWWTMRSPRTCQGDIEATKELSRDDKGIRKMLGNARKMLSSIIGH